MFRQFLAVPASTSGSGHSKPWALILVGVFFVLVGLSQTVYPRLGYRMNRWQYKNPGALEPSAAGLILIRVVGAVFAVIGIVLIVIGATK